MRGWHARRLLVLAGLLALLWSSCRPRPAPTPSDAESVPPGPEPSPTCYLQPLPTGEKVSQVVIRQAPPDRARPGESIEIELAEGYGLVARLARVCGEGEVAGTVFADELPGLRSERTAQVYLDNQPATAVQCGQVCRIEVVIPPGTAAGEHTIRVQLSSVDDTLFAIEVVDEREVQ